MPMHRRGHGLRRWKTARLILEQMGPEKAELVRDYGLRSKASHAPWDPTRPHDWWDLPVVSDRLTGELSEAEQDRSLALYLTRVEAPGRVIGRIALNNIVRGAFQSCVAGYGLAPEATGSGYMTEALDAVVSIAFVDLGLHRVEVSVIPRNSKSLAVVRRCGFTEEGLSPRYICIAGVWEDHVRFARIREDR
jgi:ribosomal-protein-alanine N-acetyltransferase